MGIRECVAEWLRKRGFLRREGQIVIAKKGVSCPHGRTSHPFKITVLGRIYELRNSPLCETCSQEYLEKFCTSCASCGEVIVPGEAIGVAWIGAPHPYTHLTSDCCETGAFYCGAWGEGEHIPLHELYPEQYPDGTGTVFEHAMTTNKMVHQNIP